LITNYSTEISLAVLLGTFLVLLIKWHNDPNNKFSLIDLIADENGKASLFRIGQAAALVVSSWAFITMVQRDKLTEFYFYGYMGVWSGINLAKNLLGKAPDASTDKA
jgi:hypothetical protein